MFTKLGCAVLGWAALAGLNLNGADAVTVTRPKEEIAEMKAMRAKLF